MDLEETTLYIMGALVIIAIVAYIIFKNKSSPNDEPVKHSEGDKKEEGNNSNKDYTCVGDKCVMIHHD